jgi:hypothetical protein
MYVMDVLMIQVLRLREAIGIGAQERKIPHNNLNVLKQLHLTWSSKLFQILSNEERVNSEQNINPSMYRLHHYYREKL